MSDRERIDRRKALGYGLAGLTAMTAGAVGGLAWYRRRQHRLGRTNLAVSVVGIGAGGVEKIEPIARAVDKGMNYVDTSTCYAGPARSWGR
jgi:hypothetical protein